jgi:hypothetical protein
MLPPQRPRGTHHLGALGSDHVVYRMVKLSDLVGRAIMVTVSPAAQVRAGAQLLSGSCACAGAVRQLEPGQRTTSAQCWLGFPTRSLSLTRIRPTW